MMKKAARFILTFVFVAAMTCLVAGAAGEVYVSENGNDGNGGTNIADSVATLSRAYALLGDDGGTIYVLGAVTVGANSTNGQANVFLEPAHSGKIRITAADANTPAALTFGDTLHWYMSGEVELDNLQVIINSNNNYIWAARHHHLTVGRNMVMTAEGSGVIILLGGCNAGGEIEHTAADTHLTLYSGTFGYIYGGSRNNVLESCCNGKTEIEVLGDIHTLMFSPGSVSTNVREALVTIDGSVTTESHFYFGGYNQTTGTVESVTFLLKSGSVDCGGVFPGGINRVQKVNVYYAEAASDLKTRFEEYLTAPLSTYCAEAAGGHDYGANGYCAVCGAAGSAAVGVEIKMTIGDGNGYVNGVAKPLDAAPIIRQNRTMLPVRFVAEALGATVVWDSATSTATLTSDATEIKITIGAATATVNGEERTLDAPAFIENSRTYLPVRFVAEALGATVAWNGATSTATITK